MRRSRLGLNARCANAGLWIFGAAIILMAHAAAAAENAALNVTRIALFSSGVGYFECDASVNGDSTAELSFRTDQINDILKSLIVRDFDGGTIGIVGYASRDPIEKTLKSFGVDITGKPTLAQLLDQLRGEPIEVSGPRKISGVIVGVERQRKKVGDDVIEFDALTVLTTAGLEQVNLAEVQGLRLTNEKIDGELRKALATLAASHDADKKAVLLQFNGQGQRRVRAAYLLEAPIWKTSYRLALANEGQPLLQGWATVENATEEDWKDVKLSLVSGRPISFTMDLYTPLYVPRPREELELYASLRPPTYEGGDVARDAAARGPATPPPSAAAAPMMAEEAFGVAGRPHARIVEAKDADGDGVADGVASVATAQEAGELFEYAITTPVTIARQHSAMLPIVNEPVTIEKFSIYNVNTHAKHPLNALRVENTTKLHLMQGPVTIFDGDVYAGDAKLPDLRPGEKRLIGYALDLGVEVTSDGTEHPEELVSLRINRGTLWLRKKYIDERIYTVRNKTDRERIVLIEHPTHDEWKLIEPAEPFERTDTLLRIKAAVPPRESGTQKVRQERIADETVGLASANFDFIDFYIRSRVISPAVKQALERLIALRRELDEAARARAVTEQRVNEAVAEQARIRENVRTLDKGSDAYARQLKKFDDLETQIENARKELETQRAAEEAKRVELNRFLDELTVE